MNRKSSLDCFCAFLIHPKEPIAQLGLCQPVCQMHLYIYAEQILLFQTCNGIIYQILSQYFDDLMKSTIKFVHFEDYAYNSQAVKSKYKQNHYLLLNQILQPILSTNNSQTSIRILIIPTRICCTRNVAGYVTE